MSNHERYEIIKTPTHRVFVKDTVLNCDSILYESEQLAQEAIKTDELDFDFELMELQTMNNFEISVSQSSMYYFDKFKIEGIKYYTLQIWLFVFEWETGKQ